MKIAVVIPNWNQSKLLAKAVASLRQQSQPVTVIVVDNGSTDDSVAMLERDFPDVVVLKNSTNLGFTGGVNPGLQYGLDNNFDILGLFNNDAEADEDWAKHLVAAFADPAVGIATGKLLNADGKRLDSTGEEYSVWGVPFPRGRGMKDDGLFDNDTSIFGATGGATFYRASMLQEIGLFDERFFLYYEDCDISFRAQLAGWGAQFVPNARAFHLISATASKMSKVVRYHASKNIVLLYLKNMPGWLFWKYLPLFTLWMFRLAISSLLKGGGWSFTRAMGRVVLYLPGLLGDRWFIQSRRKVHPSAINKLLAHHLPTRSGSTNND